MAQIADPYSILLNTTYRTAAYGGSGLTFGSWNTYVRAGYGAIVPQISADYAVPAMIGGKPRAFSVQT